MMRPDESADGAVNTTRSVSITRLACTPTLEGTNSYRSADQYVGVGCSARGAHIRYRWEFESGQWTPETADTLYDFLGFGTMSPNPRQVRLKVRNTSTGDTSVSAPRPVSLVDAVLTASGPALVWDKGTKTYSSSAAAQWFERYNPQLSWTPVSAQYVTSVQRIWPVGNYTVDVRAEDLRSGVLRRGRQPVTVCSPGPCGLMAGPSEAQSGPLEWAFFGGGPWISWGTSASQQILRFYELMGMHDMPSLFTDRNWLSSKASNTIDAGAFRISFARREAGSSDALLVDFSVVPAEGTGSYVFGMALDPDVGTSAANDESGYDSNHRLVFAKDASSAVGYMLLKHAGNALYSVDQYGTHHFAPAARSVNWTAQRAKGVRLHGGLSDVQFVLSGGIETTTATYTLVVLRGSTLAELQSTADAVLASLAGSR